MENIIYRPAICFPESKVTSNTIKVASQAISSASHNKENGNVTNGINYSIDSRAIAEMIAESLSSIKVYVTESDITSAQNSVRTIVEEASF